jgi:hypothetical protein
MLSLGYAVTAVDVDTSALQWLTEDHKSKFEVVQADLEVEGRELELWPFEGREFDAIIVTNYLHRPLFPALFRSIAPVSILQNTLHFQPMLPLATSLQLPEKLVARCVRLGGTTHL